MLCAHQQAKIRPINIVRHRKAPADRYGEVKSIFSYINNRGMAVCPEYRAYPAKCRRHENARRQSGGVVRGGKISENHVS